MALKFWFRISHSWRDPPNSSPVSQTSTRDTGSPLSVGIVSFLIFWHPLPKTAKLLFGTWNKANLSSSLLNPGKISNRTSTTTSVILKRALNLKRSWRQKRPRSFGTQPSQLNSWLRTMTIQTPALTFGIWGTLNTLLPLFRIFIKQVFFLWIGASKTPTLWRPQLKIKERSSPTLKQEMSC